LSDFAPEYLRGIELFNTGQFFDCHEVLEDIWRLATGEERAILHALIRQRLPCIISSEAISGVQTRFWRAP
jgi:predicted metal-dependent hydrolase